MKLPYQVLLFLIGLFFNKQVPNFRNQHSPELVLVLPCFSLHKGSMPLINAHFSTISLMFCLSYIPVVWLLASVHKKVASPQ